MGALKVESFLRLSSQRLRDWNSKGGLAGKLKDYVSDNGKWKGIKVVKLKQKLVSPSSKKVPRKYP